VVRQHLASPAMWSIFQLQDLLGAADYLLALPAAPGPGKTPACEEF
jgi:hypothetical protein